MIHLATISRAFLCDSKALPDTLERVRLYLTMI